MVVGEGSHVGRTGRSRVGERERAGPRGCGRAAYTVPMRSIVKREVLRELSVHGFGRPVGGWEAKMLPLGGGIAFVKMAQNGAGKV